MDTPVIRSEEPRPRAPLVAFYRDGAPDDRGRTLAEILAWPDEGLEAVHDYIQWMFPLPERSGANPSAPTLDEATIRAFHATAEMRNRLRQAFERMLRFYGLMWTGSAVERAPEFADRARDWITPMNHNHLRLTRILRSLRLLGLEVESAALYRTLEAICREYPTRISPRTCDFWRDAGQA